MDNVTIESELESSRDQMLDLVTPVVLTGTLFVISSAMLVGLTSLVWELPWGSGTRQIFISICNGMLLSLPILISLWAVFGAQTWIIRLPLAFGTLVALLTIYLATISSQPGSTPPDLHWLFSVITLAVVLSIQIPLWIIRLWKQVWISRQGTDSPGRSQFSIKHLLIATTVFALLIPLLQWFATLDSTGQMPGRVYTDAIGFCSIFILVLAFLTLLSVLIVFSPKLRIWCLCLLILGIFTLPVAVVPSIRYMLGRQNYATTDLIDTGLNVMAFSASNAITIIVVLFMYFVIGFRLRSSE